jgi:divalent metal cation (Fe/Co/Zn/Cd) transporter
MAILIGSKIRFVVYSILNVILFFGRTFAFIITRNPLMMAQSLSGFCEILFSNSRIFTFEYGQIGSAQRYGIGKMRLQYLFQIVFSMVSVAIGFFIVAEGIKDLNMEFEPIQLHTLSTVVLSLNFVFHSFYLLKGWKNLNQDRSPLDFDTYLQHSGDPQLFQFLLQLIFNVFTSFLALSAMITSYLFQTSFPEILAMLFIGSSIAVLGMYTIVTNYRFIIGNPLSPGESLKIKSHLNAMENIESVDKMMSEVLGPSKIRICLKLKLKDLKIGDDFRLRRHIHHKLHHPDRIKHLEDAEKEKIESISKKIISIEQDLKLKFRELTIIDIEAS